MTLEEFTRIVDTYGSRADAWPQESRQACEALLKTSPDARQLVAQVEELDSLLNKVPVPNFPELEQRVLRQRLPIQQNWLDSAIHWLIPDGFGIQLWRPVAAGFLPLVFGIVVGNFFSFGISDPELNSEYWDDELALLSFSDLELISDTAEFEL